MEKLLESAEKNSNFLFISYSQRLVRLLNVTPSVNFGVTWQCLQLKTGTLSESPFWTYDSEICGYTAWSNYKSASPYQYGYFGIRSSTHASHKFWVKSAFDRRLWCLFSIRYLICHSNGCYATVFLMHFFLQVTWIAIQTLQRLRNSTIFWRTNATWIWCNTVSLKFARFIMKTSYIIKTN